jgi:hypothetical protein
MSQQRWCNLKRQISLKQVTDVAKMIHLSLLTFIRPTKFRHFSARTWPSRRK